MLVSGRHLPCGCKRLSLHQYATHAALISHRSSSSRRSTAAGALVEPVAVSSSSKAIGSQQQAAAAARVLFVGGLPGDVDAETLHSQLAAACSQCSYQPTRIEVAQFDDDSQRSRFTAGWKHKGHALIAFTSESAVSQAAAAVRHIPGWGEHSVLGPARKLPKHWTPDMTLSTEELAAVQHQQAAAAARRHHNRRQRQRQQQRLIGSVYKILQALPEPGGAAVLQQYKPLIGSQLASSVALSAADGSTSGDDADVNDSVINVLLTAMPEPLRSVIRRDRLQQLLTQQQQHHQHQHQQQQLIRLAAAPSVSNVSSQLLLDWSKIPQLIDPAFGGQLAAADVVRAGAGPMNMRALRKHVQVESFALLLLQLTLPALRSQQRLHIIEFGCGSGNLVLPLAYLFPGYRFTAVDMKHSAVQLLQQRIQEGDVQNVDVIEGTIEQYTGDADVVLALHACGAASDWSLLQAKRCGAAFIVSPCCIGKINKSNTAGLLHGKHMRPRPGSQDMATGSSGAAGADAGSPAVHNQELAVQPAPSQQQSLQYPRSQWLMQHLDQLTEQVLQEQQQQETVTAAEQQVLTPLQQAVLRAASSRADRCQGVFTLLAQAADYSHQEEHGYPELAALAKSNVEFDRGCSMSELGYAVQLVRLLQPELTAKSDVLVGVPRLQHDVQPSETGVDSRSNLANRQRFNCMW